MNLEEIASVTAKQETEERQKDQQHQKDQIDVLDLGRVDYHKAWQKQKELLQLRIEERIPDTFIFCEHNPVVTLGRGAQRQSQWIDKPGIEIVPIERGGEATYHGPGQLVVYPICKLKGTGHRFSSKGLVGFIRELENWMIAVLKDYGVQGEAISGKTGVWVDQGQRKIASIGIAASHWVSYHGLAFNFSTGKDVWRGFNPCGFSANVMTDLQHETGLVHDYESIKAAFLKRLF